MIVLAFAENSVQLVPDGTLFLHIAIILLMVYVLNATLFKPINRILEERERRKKGGRGSARELLQSVEEKTSLYERTLREARADGYRLMEQERAEVMRERQTKLTAMREEIERLSTQQKQAIEAQVNAARASLTTDAPRLAAEIGAHILHRPLSDTTSSILDLRP